MRQTTPLFSLLLLLLLVGCAPASPSPGTPAPPSSSPTSEPSGTLPSPEATAPSAASTLLESSDQWRGVGRITLSSSCTAVLIDTGGDDAAAFVLTNGHCVEWMANGIILDREVEGELLFNFFADATDAHIAVPLDEVVYSTMQGRDIAIVRLAATLGELAAQGIVPFPIADAPLDPASAVRVVGAPNSGLAPEAAYLREELCEVSGRATLLEFTWHFYDQYVTSCRDIMGGSSGSPLFHADDNALYGLINTTVEGSSACYLGVPCEISADGVAVNQEASYATPLHGLAACFDDAGEFTLAEGCPLPSAEQLAFDEAPAAASQPPIRWDATLSGALPFYRYKTGVAGQVDCRSEDGYSSPIALVESPTIRDAVPEREGFYLLCVLAGDSATVDERWQAISHPTVAIAQIDSTPPTLEAMVDIRESPDYLDISLGFEPPELSDYRYIFGTPETTDCASEEDYIPYRRIPITIEQGAGAFRLCVIAADSAGNAAPPLEMLLEK